VTGDRVRVLRLTPHIYYPPPDNGTWPVRFDPVGGMQTQIFEQCVALDRLGVDQLVLAAGMPGVPDVMRLGAALEIRRAAAPMLPVRSRLRGTQGLLQSWMLGVLRAVARLRRDGERFDLVHTHGSGVVWPLAVGPMAARGLGLPHILTVHCSAGYTYHAMSRLDALQLPIARAVERWSIGRSTRVVTLTQGLERKYRERLRDGDRYVVVPDCVDAAAMAGATTDRAGEEFRRRFGVPQDKHIVTYVGRVAIEKGWRRFVRLAEHLPASDYHFLVVGDGNEGDRLRRMIREHGWSDRFTVTGFIDRPAMPGAYACADVLFLPSQHEELGSAMLEAMACGVPVVASAVGGIPQVVADGRTGILVDAGDTPAVAAKVAQIVSDPDLAKRLSEQARTAVAERFDMTATVARLRAVYDDVLNGRPGEMLSSTPSVPRASFRRSGARRRGPMSRSGGAPANAAIASPVPSASVTRRVSNATACTASAGETVTRSTSPVRPVSAAGDQDRR
jgi:glycosyltransferase involved in cell wall biosynthesis